MKSGHITSLRIPSIITLGADEYEVEGIAPWANYILLTRVRDGFRTCRPASLLVEFLGV